MANNVLTTNFNYTYDGDLSTEIFIKPAVMHPDTLQLFRVIDNVKYKRQLSRLNPFGKILKGRQGCGQPVVTGNGINVTNRTLETCKMEFYVEQCVDVFEATVLDNLTNSNINWYDLTNTELGTVIEGLIIEALQRDIFRVFSFGDTSSPAGPADYYNMCNGLWTRMFDGVLSYDVTGVDTSITTLNQTAGTRAIDYLQNLWTGAPRILKQERQTMKKFWVTGNVFENYVLNLQSVESAGGGFLQRTENGITRAFYQGIEVVPIWAWDEWIETDNLGNNTRILYSTTDNHVIGVEDASNQNSVDFWYDRQVRKNKLEGAPTLGYNYVHDELQAISYGDV